MALLPDLQQKSVEHAVDRVATHQDLSPPGRVNRGSGPVPKVHGRGQTGRVAVGTGTKLGRDPFRPLRLRRCVLTSRLSTVRETRYTRI